MSDTVSASIEHLNNLRKSNKEWTEDLSNGEFVVKFVTELNYISLVKYLDTLLPFMLNLADHYRPENKIAGIRCLDHVIKEVPLNDIKSRGIHNLIFDSLKNVLNHSDIEMLKVLLPCLLRCMKAFQFNPRDKQCVVTPSDEIMFLIQRNMELKSCIHLRSVYMENVKAFAEFMDCAIIKHNKRLLSIFELCLVHMPGINDCKLISISLDALQSVIHYSLPVISIYNCDILLILLKLAVNVLDEVLFTEAEIERILCGIQSCAKLLKEANEAEYGICFDVIAKKCKNEKVVELFSV